MIKGRYLLLRFINALTALLSHGKLFIGGNFLADIMHQSRKVSLFDISAVFLRQLQCGVRHIKAVGVSFLGKPYFKDIP